jgi:hypothetical protein
VTELASSRLASIFPTPTDYKILISLLVDVRLIDINNGTNFTSNLYKTDDRQHLHDWSSSASEHNDQGLVSVHLASACYV